MSRRTWFIGLTLLASLAISACGSKPRPAPARSLDPGLESSWQLARFALESGRYSQAVSLYEDVLARAYARDDAAAIGDVGYEYALALLRDGKYEAAAKQSLSTRVELERRNTSPFAELFLVEAVAYYKAEKPVPARSAADLAIGRARSDDKETKGRAYFILGMLAADAGDLQAVRNALSAMGHPSNESLKADRMELEGRNLIISGDSDRAIPAFEDAAALRRNLRDYAGMARALASAGAAAEKTGKSAVAADLYYRAGASATAQEDTAIARTWLNKALDLAARNGLNTIAADARDRLRSVSN